MPTEKSEAKQKTTKFPKKIELKILTEGIHPEYDADSFLRNEDLYRGDKRFFENINDPDSEEKGGKAYLPMGAAEPPGAYKRRIKHCYYVNYCQGIIDTFQSVIFQDVEKMTFQTTEGAEINNILEAFTTDADHQGTTLAYQARDTLTDALVFGAGYTLLDLPEPGEFASRYHQVEAGKLKLRSMRVSPLSVKDWQVGEDGYFDWVVLQFSESVREDFLDERINRNFWKVYTRTGWARYDEVINNKSKTKEAELTEEGVHSFGVVPLLKMTLPVGLWLLNRIQSTALNVFRTQNALYASLMKSAFAMPVLKLNDPTKDPSFGNGVYVKIQIDESFEWTEPPGNAITALENRISALIKELYRIVNQMAMSVDMTPSTAQQSGESKKMDFVPMELICDALGKIAILWLEDVLKIANAGIDDKGNTKFKAKGLDSFKMKDSSLLLDEMLKLTAINIKSPKAREIMRVDGFMAVMGDRLTEDEKNQIQEEEAKEAKAEHEAAATAREEIAALGPGFSDIDKDDDDEDQ